MRVCNVSERSRRTERGNVHFRSDSAGWWAGARIGLVAKRVATGAFTQAIVDSKGERPATRLSLVVDNAREIRAALAKPAPPRLPLPPITAKLAYGHLKNGKSPALRRLNIPKAGLDAMASGAGASIDTRGALPAPVELHRVY